MKRSLRIEALFKTINALPEQGVVLSCRLSNVLSKTVTHRTVDRLFELRRVSNVTGKEKLRDELELVANAITTAIPELDRSNLIQAMRARDDVRVATIVIKSL